MIFLIIYDRTTAKTISLETFSDGERANAEKRRLELELTPVYKARGYEIVMLRAHSEAELRHTHSRYFMTAREMGALLNDVVVAQLERTLPD